MQIELLAVLELQCQMPCTTTLHAHIRRYLFSSSPFQDIKTQMSNTNLFKKFTINLPKAESNTLINKRDATHTSAILTLSSPTDDVFDFLQIIKIHKT